MFYFIPSSEFNAYLNWIKVLLYFFTSDEYDIHVCFFNEANRGCFDNLGLNFFPEKI